MIGIIDVTQMESLGQHLADKNNPHGVTLGQIGGGLEEDTTIFVSKSGNDSTGNGTSAKPYLTINKAISSIPRNINGRNCIINIAAGTYSENIAFHDFIGGAVVVNGVTGAEVTVSGLTVENCSVLISDIKLTVGSQGIFLGSKGMLYSATANIVVSGAATGITLRYGAVLEITTSLVINNATNVAILVQYASTLSVAKVTGTGNNIGVYLYQSDVYVSELAMTANILVVNENGTFHQKGVVG